MAAIVPTNAADYRYIQYWLVANYRNIRSLAGGDLRDGLNLKHIGDIECPVPPVGEQRRIAEFLDGQVGRIDQIITLRNSQRRAFAERSAGLLQELLAEWGCRLLAGAGIAKQREVVPADWRVAELGHILRQFTNGYVGPTRDLLVDEGIRYIQSLHIKNGRIDFDRRPYFVPRSWHVERPRVHLRPQDVLIVQTGDIGQIAVVPDNIGEASCHALLIARTEPGVITGSYLGEYLRTPTGQQELLSRATGALHPHLESGIKAAPIVVPPADLQREAVAAVSTRRAQLETLDAALGRSVAKLTELKRSLITAAVTGQFDVSTANGSQVPV
jgi:type I restriction enzyme S subunit